MALMDSYPFVVEVLPHNTSLWDAVERCDRQPDAERIAVLLANKTSLLAAVAGHVAPLYAGVRVVSDGVVVFDPRAASLSTR